jgi:hypothetical protein
MGNSISAVAGTAASAPASSGSGLDAELAKCEGQLSDWVHCPSAKTPEGKEKIAEISARLDTLKARIAKRDHQPASTSAPSSNEDQNPRKAVGGAALNGLGGYLDVYA